MHPHELRKYVGSVFREYIVGRPQDFAIAHDLGGELRGQPYELVAVYESYQQFQEQATELISAHYGDRVYRGENIVLYSCCDGGYVAGY